MLRCVAISVLVASHAPDAGAQQENREVVRGRVVDDSAKAVVAATVTVTRGPDRPLQTTTTDSAGNYRVRFEEGTGLPGIRQLPRAAPRAPTQADGRPTLGRACEDWRLSGSCMSVAVTPGSAQRMQLTIRCGSRTFDLPSLPPA